jgi:hypothetical protein
MTQRRVFLIVAAVVFAGWLSWLGYLAAYKTNPVVVSRSQMMASTHFVLAEVKVDPETGLPQKEVAVKKDLRPAGVALSGTIRVENIKLGRVGGAKDFREPGLYLLPLTAAGKDVYTLTVQPRSPGQEVIDYDRVRPWAYLWDAPGVKEQFESLVP